MQTFSPKNTNSGVNRTALKRSFLTEDRKQPYYMADEFTALKHQYYKNNDMDRHLNTIGPIKEISPKFNRSINDNRGYYQNSIPTS